MKLTELKPITLLKPTNPAYKFDIRQFNKYLLENNMVIGPEAVKAYFEHLKANNYSVSTIARHKASIKAALKRSTLLIEQLAQLDIFFTNIKTGRQDKSVYKESVLSKQELTTLLALSPQKTGIIIRALFETACRVSELVSMQYKSCRVNNEGVSIKVTGKGSKEGTVYMSIDTFNQIKEIYQGKNYLFENKKGSHISRFTVLTLIKNAGKKYINRPDITCHKLRHSWATLSIDKLGLAKTSKYLRHSSTDTTARFYIHGSPEIKEIMAVNHLNSV